MTGRPGNSIFNEGMTVSHGCSTFIEEMTVSSGHSTFSEGMTVSAVTVHSLKEWLLILLIIYVHSMKE